MSRHNSENKWGEAILRGRGVPEEEIRDMTKVGKGEMSVEEWNRKHQHNIKR